MELTERSCQLRLLEHRLADLLRLGGPRDGVRPVVTLSGPVGVGKTTLLQAFARQVTESGARFLSASASRAERSVPLEVIRQLVRAAPRGDKASDSIGRLLDQGALAWSDANEHNREEPAQIIAAIGAALLKMVALGPVVIAVDDVHHADLPSLRCLDYVARRISGLTVLIVLTESPRTRPWHPEIYAELLRPTRIQRIRLPLLSPDGAYRVLAARLGVPAAQSIANECHRISGGNPLLVHALADDHLDGALPGADRLLPGEAFRDAVLSCLYRSEQLVLDAAQVLAVTEEPLHGSLLSHLVEGGSAAALPRIDGSTSAGLITKVGLRHPAVVQAVLDGMAAQERAWLHRRVACLLHEDGSPPAQVAPHLMKTDELGEPWMPQTLLEAGEQALLDGAVDIALRYLRRANRDCEDDSLRARIRSALARAEWRLDPQAAVPHLLGVATAVRAGHLGSQQAAEAIRYLLWHGQIDKAIEVIRHLGDCVDSADPTYGAELIVAKGWMATLYPGVMVNGQAATLSSRDPLTLSIAKRRLQGVTMLVSVLEQGDVSAIEDAERALSTLGLDDERSMWTATCALIAMIYADRLDLAEQWCGRMARRASALQHPPQSAILAALKAVIANRRGDLTQAQALADTALAQLSTKSWGVFIGIPLAVRLRALTSMDRMDAAAACLGIPVPPVLFETPFGLHYLHARGLHALATGSPKGALADFQLCGQLMTSWRLDLPALVPWRTESARALLWMGRHQQAAKLVREELTRLRPIQLRHRGAALRVLAATDSGPNRIQYLRDAVELLRECGDQLELAHTFTDLGHAYQQAGKLRQARNAARAARTLAQECGIPLLRPRVSANRNGTAGGDTGMVDAVDGLSETESQVATLAAQGHTNREIAQELFLTVSTIEQRLTRIYRKLNVSSRKELTARLRLNRPGATPTECRLGPPTPVDSKAATVGIDLFRRPDLKDEAPSPASRLPKPPPRSATAPSKSQLSLGEVPER